MTSSYVLHYSPATASMIVHVLLLELDVPHDLHLVDISKNQHREPDYLRLNPNGLIPTLVVDGKPMIEAAAIAMFLAERHGGGRLAPAVDDPRRQTYLQWFLHLANPMQPAYRLWFHPDDVTDVDGEQVKQKSRARIEKSWDFVEQHLEASNGPFMLGHELSALDIFATVLMRWSRNMPKPATTWPRLAALAERVTALPSWKKMNEIERLSDWF
ncbi:unnamed protein product [Aphanomyces euteiches]